MYSRKLRVKSQQIEKIIIKNLKFRPAKYRNKDQFQVKLLFFNTLQKLFDQKNHRWFSNCTITSRCLPLHLQYGKKVIRNDISSDLLQQIIIPKAPTTTTTNKLYPNSTNPRKDAEVFHETYPLINYNLMSAQSEGVSINLTHLFLCPYPNKKNKDSSKYFPQTRPYQ